MAETRRCLVLVVRPKVTLAVIPACPEQSFTEGSQCFLDQTGEDFIGFYDWIRDSSGHVLGVRQTLSEEFDKIAAQLPTPSYVRHERDPIRLEFYFSDERDYDPTQSSDQDFLMNRLLRNQLGEFAFTFGMDAEVEEDIIEGASSVDWIEIKSIDD